MDRNFLPPSHISAASTFIRSRHLTSICDCYAQIEPCCYASFQLQSLLHAIVICVQATHFVLSASGRIRSLMYGGTGAPMAYE